MTPSGGVPNLPWAEQGGAIRKSVSTPALQALLQSPPPTARATLYEEEGDDSRSESESIEE